jgi:hypothetical protein
MFLTLINGILAPDTSGRAYLTLDELQAFVGGYIESLRLPSLFDRQVTGWINEEGKLIPLSVNFILPGVGEGDVAPLSEAEAANLYLVPTPMGIPALFGASGPFDPTPVLIDL